MLRQRGADDPQVEGEPGNDRSGPEGITRRRPGLVEYGLLLALIAIVCIVAVSLLGSNASKNRFCLTVSTGIAAFCDGGSPGCCSSNNAP